MRFLSAFILSLAIVYFAGSGIVKLTSQDRIVPKLFVPYGQMQDVSKIKYNPVVRLRMANGFCTAWVVDKHYAVTAAHCINNHGYLDESLMSIFSDSGVEISNTVRAIGYDVRLDLGLLTGNFDNFESLKTSFNAEGFPKSNTDKYLHDYAACGYPLGQKDLVCTPFIPIKTDNFEMRGHSHLIPGMSGGPIVDMDTGEAVAVNTAVEDEFAIVSPVEGFWGIFGE